MNTCTDFSKQNLTSIIIYFRTPNISILITIKQFSLCTERNIFQNSFQRKTQVYSVYQKVDTKCLHPARLQRGHLEEADQKKQGILKSRPTSLMVNSLIYKPHLQKYPWQKYGWPEKPHYIGSLSYRSCKKNLLKQKSKEIPLPWASSYKFPLSKIGGSLVGGYHHNCL